MRAPIKPVDSVKQITLHPGNTVLKIFVNSV